jgi:hypothetical protein
VALNKLSNHESLLLRLTAEKVDFKKIKGNKVQLGFLTTEKVDFKRLFFSANSKANLTAEMWILNCA